jgi:hypothetical protein
MLKPVKGTAVLTKALLAHMDNARLVDRVRSPLPSLLFANRAFRRAANN